MHYVIALQFPGGGSSVDRILSLSYVETQTSKHDRQYHGLDITLILNSKSYTYFQVP